MDQINDRYGGYTIVVAIIAGLENEAVDRVPFVGVKDIIDVYDEAAADEVPKWYESYL